MAILGSKGKGSVGWTRILEDLYLRLHARGCFRDFFTTFRGPPSRTPPDTPQATHPRQLYHRLYLRLPNRYVVVTSYTAVATANMLTPSPSIRSTPYYTMAGVVSRALLRFGSVNSLISMNSKFLCGSRTSRCYSWVVLTYSIVQKSLLNQRSIWHEIIYRTMHGEKNKVFTIIFRVVKVKDLSDGITSSCIVPRNE